MIDSLSFFIFILLSIGVSQLCLSSHPYVRLLCSVFPGAVLIYLVHPLALIYALMCLAFVFLLFFVGRSTSNNRVKARLPYLTFILLFLPDVFQLLDMKPIMYIGAAFFIIRQMMTLSEGLKKQESFYEFLPASLLATFFFAALPSGPVYNGFKVWRELKERRKVSYGEGAYRLFEGFVCLFAIAGFLNLAIAYLDGMDVRAVALYQQDVVAQIVYGVLSTIMMSFLSFGFLFSTFYGYSRMAEGTALLMGFTVPQNFNNPHLAKDLSDYWKRWHRSMADFVMQYIYLPLLVTYKSGKFALIAAFLFMGVWHKVSIGFLLWGLGHGVGLAYVLPLMQKRGVSPTIIRVLSLSYVLFLSSIAHEVFL